MKRSAFLGYLVFFSLVPAGCGGGKGDLRGKVTLGDKPVRVGTVTALASDAMTYSGAIRDDGTYLIKGVPSGEVKIAVTSPDPRRAGQAPARGGDRGGVGAVGPDGKVKSRPPGEQSPATQDAGDWFPVPGKYAVPENSGLTTTVTKGDNEYDVKLR